jgi:cell division protein FtsL
MLELDSKLTLQQLLESLRRQIKDLCIMRTELDQAVAEASRSRQIIKGFLHKHNVPTPTDT